MYLGCCGDDDYYGDLSGLFSAAPGGTSTFSQVTSTIPIVGGALGAIGKLFGGGPRDVSGSTRTINALLQKALAGDIHADHNIRCLAGDNAFADEFNSKNKANPTCGFAHKEDRAVAQQAVDILDQRAASGPSAAYAQPKAAASMSFPPLLIAGAALAGVYVLMNQKRR